MSVTTIAKLELLGGDDAETITFYRGREPVEGGEVLYVLLGKAWPIMPGLYRLDALDTEDGDHDER